MTDISIRTVRLLLASVLLLLTSSAASASVVMFPLTRPNLDQGVFAFAIRVEHLPGGDARFHVTVTIKAGNFRPGCNGSVGTIDQSHGWSSVPGAFELDLKGTRDGAALHYDFNVPEKNLDDPRLLFVFENYPVDNEPALDLYYAKLKDFSRP